MMDNKSRYSFIFSDLATEVALDIEYRIGRAYRWAKKSFRVARTSMYKSKSNFNFKRRVIKLARSPHDIVQARS